MLSSESSSSSMPCSTVNAVSVETPSGYKTFSLVQGDITVLPTDLLVVSTHGNPTIPPTGLVLDALRDRYGVTIDPDCRWLDFAEHRWTCFQQQQTATFSAILTVRIPSLLRQQDPFPFFDEAIRGVFASIAALEYMEHSFSTVSLPVLYGQRMMMEHDHGAEIYPIIVESMIRHALRWLKASEKTNKIQFVVYEPGEVNAWSAAMDKCLGRSLIEAGTDGVIKSLCQEIRQQAYHLADTPLQRTLAPLVGALANPDRIYVQNVCVSGRKLVEEMLLMLMPLWNLPMQKELMNNINALEREKRVAPWITSYMHSLRVFGNEEVHAKAQAPDYRPSRMEKGELVSALSAIRALLSSWPEIRQGKNV